MARPKSSTTISTDEKKVEIVKEEDVKIEEQIPETNTVEENMEVKETPVEEITENKDGMVKILCVELKGKSVIGLDANNPVQFDENGKAEVSWQEAKRFLTIPGYEKAK